MNEYKIELIENDSSSTREKAIQGLLAVARREETRREAVNALVNAVRGQTIAEQKKRRNQL